MEQEKQDMTLVQRLQNHWRAFRQTNWRAQAHYTLFRTAQNMKNKSGLLQQYKQQFMAGWEKWLGMGAGITGLLMLLNPDGIWRWQLPLVVLGILLAPLLANLLGALKRGLTEYPGKQLIGQVITLEQAIVAGSGSIRLDNQEWQLAGVDCPAGTPARIIALKDRTLYITPLSQPE